MLILKGQRIISLMLRGCWIEISILKFIKDDKWRRTLFHVQNGNESRFVRHPRFVAPDHAMQQCGQSMAKRALNQFQQAPHLTPIPFFCDAVYCSWLQQTPISMCKMEATSTTVYICVLSPPCKWTAAFVRALSIIGWWFTEYKKVARKATIPRKNKDGWSRCWKGNHTQQTVHTEEQAFLSMWSLHPWSWSQSPKLMAVQFKT